MNKIEIKANGKPYPFLLPAGWGEITRRDFLNISPLLMRKEIFSRDMLKGLIHLDTQWGVFKPGRKQIENIMGALPSPLLLPLYDCIKFMEEDPCTSPPFEYIKIKGTRYLLPSEHFKNVSLIEWAFLDMCYTLSLHFEKQNQPDKMEHWLNKLCSYMCRPKGRKINPKDPKTYMGDRREKFNTAIIDNRFPKFKQRLKPVDQYGCLLFFVGVKRYLSEKYKGYLWSVGGDDVIGVARSTKPEPFKWMAIARQLAGGKFGSLKETQFANLHDVLEELKDQKKQRL